MQQRGGGGQVYVVGSGGGSEDKDNKGGSNQLGWSISALLIGGMIVIGAPDTWATTC